MKNKNIIEKLEQSYQLGFSSNIENEDFPIGLNYDIIKKISQAKNEPSWLLEWRLKSFDYWLKMKEPNWAHLKYPKIDYQSIYYFGRPKKDESNNNYPELESYFEKLGVPLTERDILSGKSKIAVDAILDSESIGTTFKEQLNEVGIIFCSFSEAVQNHPELIKKYLGSVVPYTDNYYSALNSAVFSDGSFCYIPKGVKSPMELSTYFRINQANLGQFERTLIIAEEGAYVSYLEGCFLPHTLVYTDKGLVPIQNIGPDTIYLFTYDHLGNLQKILNRQEKIVQNKPIFSFHTQFFDNHFTCTEEHPIYIYRNNEFLFCEAKDIKIDDYLCIHSNQIHNLINEFNYQTNNNLDHLNFIYKDDYYLIPISNITKNTYSGIVYNLEVANTHTYNVYGFAVHNCSAPQRDENQLHAAVVEIIALDNAEVKYSTVQNWYPGDKDGKGGIYNFVTKRALCAGYKSKVSWTQIETGSAITWKYPSIILKGDYSSGEFYSVALTNHFQQADTGTKMIHLGSNTTSSIISKSISAGKSISTYRGLVKISGKAENCRNITECDSLLFGDSQVNTFPYIENNNYTSILEHEATTSKISEDILFYLMQKGLSDEQAKNMLVNGFCKSIFKKLPAEFAVEAQKLLELNLEGSMG